MTNNTANNTGNNTANNTGTTSTDHSTEAHYSWGYDLKITGVILAAGAVNAINIAKLAPSIDVVQAAFSLSLPEMGLLVSLFSVLFVLGGIVTGTTVKAIGAKRSMVGGMMLALVGMMMTLYLQNIESLFIGRVIEGIGLITVMLTSPALITQHTSTAKRGVLMGLWSGFMPLGNALALFGAPLILIDHSWPALWVVGAVLMVIAIVMAIVVIPQDRIRPLGRFDLAAIAHTIRRRNILYLGLLFGCHSIIYQAMLQFMPSFAKDIFGIPIFWSSLVTVAFCLLSFSGNIIAGRFLMRGWTPQQITRTAGSILGILMLVMSMVASTPVVFGAVLCVFGLITGAVPTVCFYVMSFERTDDARNIPIFTAWMFQVQGLGMFFGPVLFANIVDAQGSWLIGIAAFSIVCFAKVVLSFFIKITR